MFRFVVLIGVFVAAYAKPGILGSSLSIAGTPAIVAAPALNIVRTAPINLGSTIGIPLALNGGLISNGVVSDGLISNGIVAGGLISGGLVSSGLVSDGVIGGLVKSGKILAK